MYYSTDYIELQKKEFNLIKGSEFYSKDVVENFLKIEGRFTLDISENFLGKQGDRFPFGIINDFLTVYPKLNATFKTRYNVEKEFLLRAMDTEGYLVGAREAEIELLNEYYKEGYNIGGKTALVDIKSALGSGGTDMKKLGQGITTFFNLTDPVVRDKLKWEAGRQITRINETTRRKIVNTLINSYDTGKGYDGMKKDLKLLFESWKVPKSGQWFTNKRAEMIARTELGQAVSWAREESYARRDVRKKSWLSEPNACPSCVTASNDGIIAFSSTFSNSFLGPLAHPNCRCALLPEVEIQDYVIGYTWHGEAQNQVHTQT